MSDKNDNYKICFIISHKYVKNYKSYIKYYIDNIKKYYKNSLCIIVDNNSKSIKDIIDQFYDYKDVIILTNISLCKFELGAYKFGIYYLIENNLLFNYDYIIFSQDNFILKNKFDFNEMKNNNISAMSFVSGEDGVHNTTGPDYLLAKHTQYILKRTNFLDNINKLSICWACSFILHNSKVQEFLDITKDIIITNRQESIYSERYLDAILLYLNKKRSYMYNIFNISYDCWTVNLLDNNIKESFVKSVQQKTELTQEI